MHEQTAIRAGRVRQHRAQARARAAHYLDEAEIGAFVDLDLARAQEFSAEVRRAGVRRASAR